MSREYKSYTKKKQTPFFYSTLTARLYLGKPNRSKPPGEEPKNARAKRRSCDLS